MKRIKGIDSIRFICALFVMIGHFTIPNPHGYLQTADRLRSLIFNGPAAVIVFFIISGFCIHYPFQNKEKIDIIPYYTKRIIRIGTPAIIAILLYAKFHLSLKPPNFSVFWSILCEVIYYLVYPFLFYLNKSTKLKWTYLILISYLISVILGLTNLDVLEKAQNSYTALGFLTWLIGLPCWLLGCWLSENYLMFSKLSLTKMLAIRLLMLILVFVLGAIKFHVHTAFGSNCFTLNLFAFFACIWLGFEIVYFQSQTPFYFFEWCGKWSYSLYIIHPLTFSLILFIGIGAFFSKYSDLLMLFSTIPFALVFACIFYIIVEKPSHKLAVIISLKFK